MKAVSNSSQCELHVEGEMGQTLGASGRPVTVRLYQNTTLNLSNRTTETTLEQRMSGFEFVNYDDAWRLSGTNGYPARSVSCDDCRRRKTKVSPTVIPIH